MTVLTTQNSLGQTCPSIRQFGHVEIAQLQSAVDLALPECLEKVDFLALKGRLALERGDFEVAMTWLEKSAMLAPDQPYILLEYANAARASGELYLARGIVEDLLLRNDMPMSLRSDLQTWLLSAVQQQVSLVREFSSWSGGVGYDTNINRGSSQSSLTLTLPTGNLQLGLDPKLLAKSSLYVIGQGNWLGIYKDINTAQSFQVKLQGQIKQPIGQSENYSQQNVDFEFAQINPHWLEGVKAHWMRLQHSQFANRALLSSVSTGLVWAAQPMAPSIKKMACKAEKGLDIQYHTHEIDTTLNGLAPGGSYGMRCENNSFWGLMQGRVLWDFPISGQRAGGDFFSAGLVVALGITQDQWAHQVVTRLDYQQDIDSYSILIKNGEKRQLLSKSLMIESSYKIAPRLKGIFRIESKLQNSNISLFSLRSHGIFSGLSYNF